VREATDQRVNGGGTRWGAGSLLARTSLGTGARGPRRIPLRALLIVGLAVTMFGGGALGLLVRTHPSGRQDVPTARPAPAVPVVDSGSLPQLITSLQRRLRALPADWRSFARLGSAYVQEARMTADPTYYPKAEGALARSLALHGGGNFEALTGMAALAAARHDFAGALAWAERAVAVNPYSADARAIKGDAQLELGRYDEAFATFQKAVDLKPELSTYARVSYAWELQGNVPNAIRAMGLALDSAGTAADSAWAANQLGELYWNSGGRLELADRWYRFAMARDPSFVPPRAGVAKLEAARGQLGRAIRDYTWVVDRYPLPEYVIALGDVLSVSGRADAAARQYQLVHVEEQLFRAGGVNVDLEIALFDADHHVDLAAGLAAAWAEWGRRHSIHVADALGWQLYANGRYAEALAYADRALRLGTRSALFLFHRGMIERALGMTAAARRDLAAALRINPRFSILWGGRAGKVLRSLGGGP